MSIEWYALKFTPVFKGKPWGGRRLEKLFGKLLPPGPVGESWEISAHPEGRALVSEGALAGKSLAELVRAFRGELLGSRFVARSKQFPIIVKFLDAQDLLSLQVHPDDAYARAHTRDDGKEECWFVIHVGPKGRVFKGLKRKVAPEEFLEAVHSGQFEALFNIFRPRAGDLVYLPAGTLHTVEDVVVAEVQQASDLTFRVYDWNRPGTDGKRRSLHMDKALAVAELGPPAQNAAVTAALDKETTLLIDSQHFRIERVSTANPRPIDLAGEAFRVLIVLSGSGRVGEVGFRAGDCLLLPAALEKAVVEPAGDSDYLVMEAR